MTPPAFVAIVRESLDSCPSSSIADVISESVVISMSVVLSSSSSSMIVESVVSLFVVVSEGEGAREASCSMIAVTFGLVLLDGASCSCSMDVVVVVVVVVVSFGSCWVVSGSAVKVVSASSVDVASAGSSRGVAVEVVVLVQLLLILLLIDGVLSVVAAGRFFLEKMRASRGRLGLGFDEVGVVASSSSLSLSLLLLLLMSNVCVTFVSGSCMSVVASCLAPPRTSILGRWRVVLS